MLRDITYYPALCLYRIQSYISLVVESCAQSAAQTKMALSQLQQLDPTLVAEAGGVDVGLGTKEGRGLGG